MRPKKINYFIILFLLILLSIKEGSSQNKFIIYSNQFSCVISSFDQYYNNDLRKPEETGFKPVPVLYPTKYSFNKSDTNKIIVNLKNVERIFIDSLINISGEILLDSSNSYVSYDSMPIIIVGTMVYEPYEFKVESHRAIKISGPPIILDAYFIKDYSFYYLNTLDSFQNEIIKFNCKLRFQDKNDVLIIAKKGCYSVIFDLKEIFNI